MLTLGSYVLTPDGLREINQLSSGDLIWSGESYIETQGYKSSIRTCHQYKFSNGVFVCSSDFFSSDSFIPFSKGPELDSFVLDTKVFTQGYILGAGQVKDKTTYVNALRKDIEYIKDNYLKDYILDKQSPVLNTVPLKSLVPVKDLGYFYDRRLSRSHKTAHTQDVADHIRGAILSKGLQLSKTSGTLSVRLSSWHLVSFLHIALSSLGIHSYIKSSGQYKGRKIYRLLIKEDIEAFQKLFCPLVPSLDNKINYLVSKRKELYSDYQEPTISYKLQQAESVGKQRVYLPLINSSSFWCNGYKLCLSTH